MVETNDRHVLVTGATGFVGGELIPALLRRGHSVVGASRRAPGETRSERMLTFRTLDLLRPETLGPALEGIDIAYYLVHSMGQGRDDFRDIERRSAEAFVRAAEVAELGRIVYLGGPAPLGTPSEHLRSRLEVGEILRGGAVPTIELRASMVVGAGGAAWQIVRDLALRLPVMVLPSWLESRTCPVAIDDVIVALVAAAEIPIEGSVHFDLPGPEALSGKEILERIAAIRGRRIPAVAIPLISPRLSALWLKLVTSADYALARELVLGLERDLLPADDRYWELIGRERLVPFDEAASRALAREARKGGLAPTLAHVEETLVDRFALRHRP